MSHKGGLSFDNDICPLLTAMASPDPKTQKARYEICRPDCAWRDTETHSCAIMSINVQLKILTKQLEKLHGVIGFPETDS